VWVINSALGKLFGFFFFPFRSIGPWPGMILVSFLTAIFMLFVFRFTSNQKGIREVKNKIKAHLLELRLFKDSLSLSLEAQGKILLCNLKYISYSLKPMLVMIIPLVLILSQLNLWFGHKPLILGERTILKVKVNESAEVSDIDFALESSPGLEAETPPLRIDAQNEMDWSLKAKENGSQVLVLKVEGKSISKRVEVSPKTLVKVSAIKVRRNFFDELLNPGEKPIPSELPLKKIEVDYPPQSMNLFGWNIHWIIIYFVLSIIFSFSFRRLFKVEI
jgi:uncharacterized membrane protein (DUF106 family)